MVARSKQSGIKEKKKIVVFSDILFITLYVQHFSSVKSRDLSVRH